MKILIIAALLGAAWPAAAQSQAPWPHDDNWADPYQVDAPVGEAKVYLSTSMPSVNRSDYWLDFDALDQNGDGYLSRAEVRRPAPSQTTRTALENLGREFRAVDVDGDGRLARSEIVGWL